MKKCNIIIIIIGIILIIVSIYITYRIFSEEPCHSTWDAIVEVDPVTVPLTPVPPRNSIYTLYTVTVTTDIDRILEISGIASTYLTATPLQPERTVNPGETVLYDSLLIEVDESAVPTLGIVCVVVNEKDCDIPKFRDCIPIQIVVP